MFGKKKENKKSFDRERLSPIIRCSICSGEQVAGFLDKKTGEITEISLIQSDKDLERFKQTYGIEEEIKKVY